MLTELLTINAVSGRDAAELLRNRQCAHRHRSVTINRLKCTNPMAHTIARLLMNGSAISRPLAKPISVLLARSALHRTDLSALPTLVFRQTRQAVGRGMPYAPHRPRHLFHLITRQERQTLIHDPTFSRTPTFVVRCQTLRNCRRPAALQNHQSSLVCRARARYA